jgi:hypothetical protein
MTRERQFGCSARKSPRIAGLRETWGTLKFLCGIEEKPRKGTIYRAAAIKIKKHEVDGIKK